MILASIDCADVGLQLAHPAQLDERGRQEAAQPDVDDQAALHDLDDRSLDDAVGVLDLLDRPPGPLVLGALLGQDETTFFVLFLEDERFDAGRPRLTISEGSTSLRMESSRDRDDPFGLEADVEKDFVLVDLDDRALDDVTVVELDDGGVDGVLEGLHRRGRLR